MTALFAVLFGFRAGGMMYQPFSAILEGGGAYAELLYYISSNPPAHVPSQSHLRTRNPLFYILTF